MAVLTMPGLSFIQNLKPMQSIALFHHQSPVMYAVQNFTEKSTAMFFMYKQKKIPYDEPVPGKENEFIVHYRDTLCHAQTFRCSVTGDDKTIVLSYVDPDELPGELGDVEEYKNGLLSLLNDYDDFNLSSKLFINEGEIVLKAADYEDEGRNYTDFDFVLEWDGKEYILENR